MSMTFQALTVAATVFVVLGVGLLAAWRVWHHVNRKRRYYVVMQTSGGRVGGIFVNLDGPIRKAEDIIKIAKMLAFQAKVKETIILWYAEVERGKDEAVAEPKAETKKP